MCRLWNYIIVLLVIHGVCFLSVTALIQTGDLHPSRRPRSSVLFSSATSSDKLSVAILGSGAIGSYYGARLHEGGHNVHFLMRGPHLDACCDHGLHVTSIDDEIYIPPDKLQVYEQTRNMMHTSFDWVLVCIKTCQLETLPDLILPLLTEKTNILLLMNGLLIEEHVAQMLQSIPYKALYGGMAFVCCNRVAPGRIQHTYAGLLVGGCYADGNGNSSIALQTCFENLWKPTKVKTQYEQSLLRGRWSKVLWNMPFSGLSVSMGGITVDKIVSTPSLRQLAFTIMDEVVEVANADLQVQSPTSCLFTKKNSEYMMSVSDQLGAYKTSTMIDLVNRNPMEVEYLFQSAQKRARALGVTTPHMDSVVALVEAYQYLYKL
jgi:2-dehydropantoate 2-reductase